MRVIRGDSPMRPMHAAAVDNPNNSPLSKLFTGYRKGTPPGLEGLIPGNAEGMAINGPPTEWADRYWEGDPDYQSDEKWFEAVLIGDRARRHTAGVDDEAPPAANPPGGPAGFSTMIARVLNFALGANAQAGVTQPASNTTGLGATGTLSVPYAAPATLGDIATALVGAQAAASATATAQLSTEQAVQTTLQGKLTSQSGVNMDTEMSQMIALQNAYGANAKVIAAVQAMYTQLLSAVQ